VRSAGFVTLAAPSPAGAAHAGAASVIGVAGFPFTFAGLARFITLALAVALTGRASHGLLHRLLHLLELFGILRGGLHLLELLSQLLLGLGHLLTILLLAAILLLRGLLHGLGHRLRRLGHAVGLRLSIGGLL